MHKFAIDASVAAKWQLSDEPDAERARGMLRDYAAEQVGFVTPRLWCYEVANIFNKAISIRRLTEVEGRQAFEALQALDIEYVEFPSPQEAYHMARSYRRSVYDSLYLAVAQTHGIELWTGDRKLFNAIKRHLPFVRWIGDYVSIS